MLFGGKDSPMSWIGSLRWLSLLLTFWDKLDSFIASAVDDILLPQQKIINE